jgi:hypothetical protein
MQIRDPGSPRHRVSCKVEQKSPGKFEVPAWDLASQKKVRDALVVLGSTLPDGRRMFGRKDEADPDPRTSRHLVQIIDPLIPAQARYP